MRSSPASISLIERFIEAKSGVLAECEDAIVLTDHFAAVLDGATAKSGAMYDGQTPGRLAIGLIGEAIVSLKPDASGDVALASMNGALSDYYAHTGALEHLSHAPSDRPQASAVIFSLERREIWSVGDCQFRYGGHTYTGQKKRVDAVLGASRSVFLELELLSGKTITELRADDTGRRFIWPALKRQGELQNAGRQSPYSFSVIDGFPINGDSPRTFVVPNVIDEIVLASDGYPHLADSLAQSEDALSALLMEDPLCMRLHVSTKGRGIHDCSFDDRAFLKIGI